MKRRWPSLPPRPTLRHSRHRGKAKPAAPGRSPRAKISRNCAHRFARGIDTLPPDFHCAGMPEAPALRRPTAADSAAALALVATVLHEFGLKPDPTCTDADLADFERHYFARGGDFAVLVDAHGAIVGTCGLYPFEGADAPRTVELRKMYLAPALRGRGQGRRLLEWALARARELGFTRMTLETAAVLQDAVALYERNGFKPDCGGLHSCRCDAGYARDL